MPRRGIRFVLAAALIALVPVSPAHAGYGSGRFRAVQLYITDGVVEAYVDGYVGEGTSTAEVVGTGGGFDFQYVCARVVSSLGTDAGCGQVTVNIAWPLLQSATLRGTIGSIAVDMGATARAAPTVSPLVALGPYPIFANTGVIVYRPGTAVGTVTSSVGSVTGTTTQVSLYGLTSVYGSPD